MTSARRKRDLPVSRDPAGPSGRREAGLGPLAAAALALGGLILLLAPAASNAFWGVNGFRSLPASSGAWVLALAVAAGVAGALRVRGPRLLWVLAPALALGLAYLLPERIHFLGDTQLRLRALATARAEPGFAELGAWTAKLHASPLDALVDLWLPLTLMRLGLPQALAISTVSAGLALICFAGLWRVAGRLCQTPETRLGLWLALALNGTLQAFAGYADSAGLVAAAAAWWWAGMLGPLDRGRRGWTLGVSLLVLLSSHRLGIAVLGAQLVRILGPRPPGGERVARRSALLATTAAVATAVAATGSAGVFPQLDSDFRELLATARAGGAGAAALGDVANTVALVAPLALLAPALAGRAALRAFVRLPASWCVVAAAAPLLAALVWLFPVGESGLGAHRDWDANVLLGMALTVGGGALLARASPSRRGPALAAALPLLALSAFGWVGVNADSAAAARRAVMLASEPSSLTDSQRSHAYLFLGQRAMDLRRPDVAAPHLERASELNPNPRRALMAAEAWMWVGDFPAARRAIARARSRGPLNQELEASARLLEARLLEAPPDGAVPAPR